VRLIAGVLWKHVEYRDGHAETRRARVLVLQSSYTIVNYGALQNSQMPLAFHLQAHVACAGPNTSDIQLYRLTKLRITPM
jgi:hypothetical protein